MTPWGSEFRELRRIYHTLLQNDEDFDFRRHQEEESIHLLHALVLNPSTFLFECERFAINVLFRPMYGHRLCSDDNMVIAETYKVWEMMYRCTHDPALTTTELALLTEGKISYQARFLLILCPFS